MASNQIIRTLSAIELLAEHICHGISQAELARALGVQSTEAGRILANLMQAEWAEKTPHNNRLYRLTPRVGGLSHKVEHSLRVAREQLRQDASTYAGF
ncbi:hypothetical protein DS2_10317 [Catenovulum agarivorans DS-2]|uniref:HTH iclR-type domain-containing protein n=1 Tax=Catenovulum agarivorans DS-2 TaxID=1328313 RepID=W7QLM0_9ALTE|nr:hypothetical protein [Catenovulum agarivorans]EWH09837.1 hypothetical protein DS2_10317 [Catenovulum agarivorans DS-2]